MARRKNGMSAPQKKGLMWGVGGTVVAFVLFPDMLSFIISKMPKGTG